MLYIINFADAKYEKIRKLNSFTARYIAKADRIIEYRFEDIDSDFFNENSEIFKIKYAKRFFSFRFVLSRRFTLSRKNVDVQIYNQIVDRI